MAGEGDGSAGRPLIVMDDSEDDDEVVVAVPLALGVVAAGASASSSKRKRGGTGQRQRASDQHSGSSGHSRGDDVVDLTRPSSSSASRRHESDDEIEFVGSRGGGGGVGGAASLAAAASSTAAAQLQLAQYRSEAAASYVQFVGSTRPLAAAAAAVADPDGGGFEYDGSDREWLPPPVAVAARRQSTPTQKKAKRKRGTKAESPPPMEKGKSLLVPTGFDALDMYYPHLKANDRSAVLHWLLAPGGCTKKFAHEWRVAYEKRAGAKPTLWAMVSALSDEIADGAKKGNGSPGTTHSSGARNNAATMKKKQKSKVDGDDDDDDDDSDYDGDLDRKMPAVPTPKKGKKGKENKKPADKMLHALISDVEDEQDEKKMGDDCEMKVKSVLSIPSIGILSGELLDTLRQYFRAHVGRNRHKAKLESIETISDGSGDGLACSVCCDAFNPEDTVPCSGETELHFFCKSCFSSYATVTVQSGPIQSIACPVPECDSLFATADAKANLSAWDLLMIEHRETSRDRRVALAAKAVLHCECGAVAIITEEDIGNGRVTCPGEGCGKRYCCKCGNDDHGTEPCPPPAETVQWLDNHSKECPNCKNRIQKNGGCDHMTCMPPGGCGFEFWWTCGCPYRGSHRPGCQRLGEM